MDNIGITLWRLGIVYDNLVHFPVLVCCTKKPAGNPAETTRYLVKRLKAKLGEDCCWLTGQVTLKYFPWRSGAVDIAPASGTEIRVRIPPGCKFMRETTAMLLCTIDCVFVEIR
jgi:hypothetical protein